MEARANHLELLLEIVPALALAPCAIQAALDDVAEKKIFLGLADWGEPQRDGAVSHRKGLKHLQLGLGLGSGLGLGLGLG